MKANRKLPILNYPPRSFVSQPHGTVVRCCAEEIGSHVANGGSNPGLVSFTPGVCACTQDPAGKENWRKEGYGMIGSAIKLLSPRGSILVSLTCEGWALRPQPGEADYWRPRPGKADYWRLHHGEGDY